MTPKKVFSKSITSAQQLTVQVSEVSRSFMRFECPSFATARKNTHFLTTAPKNTPVIYAQNLNIYLILFPQPKLVLWSKLTQNSLQRKKQEFNTAYR